MMLRFRSLLLLMAVLSSCSRTQYAFCPAGPAYLGSSTVARQPKAAPAVVPGAPPAAPPPPVVPAVVVPVLPVAAALPARSAAVQPAPTRRTSPKLSVRPARLAVMRLARRQWQAAHQPLTRTARPASGELTLWEYIKLALYVYLLVLAIGAVGFQASISALTIGYALFAVALGVVLGVLGVIEF